MEQYVITAPRKTVDLALLLLRGLSTKANVVVTDKRALIRQGLFVEREVGVRAEFWITNPTSAQRAFLADVGSLL